MAEIYKTTERVGKRHLLTLPVSKDGARAIITGIASRMGWDYQATGNQVDIKFHHGDQSATYTIEENSLSLGHSR